MFSVLFAVIETCCPQQSDTEAMGYVFTGGECVSYGFFESPGVPCPAGYGNVGAMGCSHSASSCGDVRCCASILSSPSSSPTPSLSPTISPFYSWTATPTPSPTDTPSNTPCPHNLVTNGDFELGWYGFSSYYVQSSSLQQEGRADVFQGPGLQLWRSVDACTVSDHTTGGGKFFGANGDPNAHAIAWESTTRCSLHLNNVYRFHAWVTPLNRVYGPYPGPNLQFWIAPLDGHLAPILLGGDPFA